MSPSPLLFVSSICSLAIVVVDVVVVVAVSFFFCFDKVRRRSGHPVDFFAKHVFTGSIARSMICRETQKRKKNEKEKKK